MSRVVVKVGGAASELDPAAEILPLLEAGDEVVLVHGAGPQITQEMERRGLEVRFVGGRRFTSPEALEVVRDSLAHVNAALCAALAPRAVGLAGDEIGLQATHLPELGLVGDPRPSAPPAVLDALAAGLVPVVAPLAVGPLNVNADDAAVALAAGLGAERLRFVTDVLGLLLDGSVTARIDADEAQALLDAGALAGGIVPKLRAAVQATRLGIRAEIGATLVSAATAPATTGRTR